MITYLIFMAIVVSTATAILAYACKENVKMKERRGKDYSAFSGCVQDTLYEHWLLSTTLFLSLLVFLLMSMLVCSAQFLYGGQHAEFDEEYKSVTYLVESGVYADTYGRNDYLVIERISEFNQELRKNQWTASNPWLSWFVPSFYLDYDLIEYTDVPTRANTQVNE